MTFRVLICVMLLVYMLVSVKGQEKKANDESNASLKLYQKLFKVKRKEHIVAVQKLILENSIEKKAKLIKIMLETIIQTTTSALKSLESKNVDLEQFPEDLQVKDELGNVLENTALFADIIVRFPKLAQSFYKKHTREWKLVIEDAIDVCNKSGVYDGDNQMIIRSLQQELGIGEVDPTYENPFKQQESIQHPELTSEERQMLYKEVKIKKKLQKKMAKRKGPKLSKQEL